jgi:threonine synthase
MWGRRREPLRFSGVWRFWELLPFAPQEKVVTVGEGQTLLQEANRVAEYVGIDPGSLFLQYEGMNPSGSFKDNGMSAAFTHARMTGAQRAACASTGNTSASLGDVLLGHSADASGHLYWVGKNLLRETLAGSRLRGFDGADRRRFDDAMARVREVSRDLGIYLVNSVNPFRLEGQKTIMYRVLEALAWEPPDWIVVPGGNLGNSSAFGKAFIELKQLGLINRIPRLGGDQREWSGHALSAVRRSKGYAGITVRPSRTVIDKYFATMDTDQQKASTIASAIEINRPVNLMKCLRALDACDGVVRSVSDQEILDAKARVGAGGIGCEPASAASVAGAKLLSNEGIIAPSDRVVCILTGHLLKDPTATVAYHTTDQEQFNEVLGKRGVRRASFANRAIAVRNELPEIIRAIQLYS